MTTGGEVLSLSIDSIAIGERIGFFSGAHAARLGSSMAEAGQHTPIHVRRNGNAAKLRWTLVAGLHRLRGAKAIGWSHIDAKQVADAATRDDELRRLELAENLSHRHPRPIERAIMMAAHARLEEALDHPDHVGETPQARALRIRQSTSVTVTDVSGWRRRTADAFDVSLSTFEKHQRIYRDIVEAMPDLAQALNEHPLGECLRNIERLAGLRLDNLHRMRRVAAEKVLERDDWKTIADAFESAGIKESNGFRAVPRAKVMNAWLGWSLNDRQAHVEWLADEVTPGMALNMVNRFKERGLLP
ncbi:ParB N-terminal domain-containing protein [Novosphingobium colocasiae]|uniref:ParB N-terminal domain-containing protein n=1 Tax=Novosphingobium colocasiae TaxID=1256513 RepID=UPI0035B042DA